ncbi:hypothetical protein NBZ79_15460 [Sneathiella marina]|uniref:Transporter n=1 Tax=Sneathiella marina TaxID=2950108 RepID=A0ABY4W371_9PROT|nr:hypothetical protein [Sneathiella marina]USG60563.1 hypothetical protein NBZ79_15460 [Sneathiella marina]
MKMASWSFLIAVILGPAASGTVKAADAETSDQGLATELANPIASLISVPIQVNYTRGIGTANGDQWTTNIQPVIPFDLNDDWSLVTRTILPVISQSDVAGLSGDQIGLGDTLQSFFFVPTPAATDLGTVTWGAGPAVTWPTSTDKLLGAGTWGLGPTAVALVQKKIGTGNLTWGGLANHQWGLKKTRSAAADLNYTFVQPFVSYTTADAWTYSLNSESLYNWTSDDWTVPINVTVAKFVHFGELPVQLTGGVGYFATSPDSGPEGWKGRFVITFLLPK